MDQPTWELMRRTPLFGVLPREVAEWLLEGQGVRVYEKGALLFEQGRLRSIVTSSSMVG